LSPEVALYDPRLALDGGVDGLDAYRAISGDLARLLKADGAFFLEIGAGQADAVTAILAERGWPDVWRSEDLAGRPRILAGKASSPLNLPFFEEASWREGKKRLPLATESSSPRCPSESRAAADPARVRDRAAPLNA
jgi:hypothetical protein